ncbi:MAG TPA: FtsX-like permease family protein [Steroidobacteraceae bacterium]|nr:FtsX-like permease family protein [Steroidobacteraceae bacterium]
MKYLHLVWAAMLRRKARTLLTLLSIMLAFLLFGVLDSVRSAFMEAGHNVAAVHRLVTFSKASLTVPLPKSLYSRIEAVPGVSEAAYVNWFGGYYQTPKHALGGEAVGAGFFALFPEYEMPATERRAFAAIRTGVVVGEGLARRYHWKLGDKIPVQADIFAQKNGSNTWTFDLVGIYHVSAARLESEEYGFYFHWDYFDQASALGNGTVNWYVERVADPRQADRIARAIDALSANSDHETQTQREDAFAAHLISQYVDMGPIVGAILGAVFFTLILLTSNTMTQAVRERVPELAILKTLGFPGRGILSLVLGESVLLLASGGAAGLVLASLVVGLVRARLGAQIPLLPVGWAIWLQGLGLTALIGVLVGALPARHGMRLRIVDALSGH